MTKQNGHWNRSARKSGGDRKFVINVPNTNLTKMEIAVRAIMIANPDWTLEQVANKAMEMPGATVQSVKNTLEKYVDEAEITPPYSAHD